MAKFEQIAKTLEGRIRHGDYHLRGFPSHAELSEQLNANSRTITKALGELVERGILIRKKSGRVDLPKISADQHLRIAMLMPTFPSPENYQWYRIITENCAHRGWSVKSVAYSHWDDTAISEAFRGMDAMFLVSLGDNFPKPIIHQMKAADIPVIVLEQDVSAHGIPCLRAINPGAVHLFVEHLEELGHHRIACLNTQPLSSVIDERIEAWHLWAGAHNRRGSLINQPTALYGSPALLAYRVVGELLRSKKLTDTAIIATTGPTALGAMRAITDAGLRIPHDIAVCSADNASGIAPFLPISLTSLIHPDTRPLIQVCLDYIDHPGRDWIGPLLIQPVSQKLFIGQSTQPDPKLTTPADAF